MDDLYIIGGIREHETSVTVEVVAPNSDGTDKVKRLRMTHKMWERFSVVTGDTVSHETFSLMESCSQRCEAVTRALKFLSASPHSEKALFDKLCRAGYSEEACASAMELVTRRGLIDEAGQAAEIAEKLARTKHRGPSRIAHDIAARGYPRDVAVRAAQSVSNSIYQQALRAEFSKKCKNGDIGEKNERDKIIASLVRSGFSVGDILKLINKYE